MLLMKTFKHIQIKKKTLTLGIAERSIIMSCLIKDVKFECLIFYIIMKISSLINIFFSFFLSFN
jgi:hypothetical protein